jgi:outer membrane protein assembly factor BamE (lipoprotein component of BamABCDE complex)
MRKFVLVAMTFVLSTLLGACGLVSYTNMSQGTEIKQDQLAKIKPGMSKQDVLIALGEPTKVKDVENNKVWFYCWQRGGRTSVFWGTFGSDSAKSYCATIIFDKNGKVLRTGKGRAGQASMTPVFTVRQEKVNKDQQKKESW